MVARAVRSCLREKTSPEAVERLGGGWVGDEALAISLHCVMAAKGNFARGVRLAVNHSGDSDSTGAITGNIPGPLEMLVSIDGRALHVTISAHCGLVAIPKIAETAPRKR